MSTKAKKPKKKDPRAVKITKAQVGILNQLAAEKTAIESSTTLALATIAAGVGIERWGDVSLDGLTLTFGEPKED